MSATGGRRSAPGTSGHGRSSRPEISTTRPASHRFMAKTRTLQKDMIAGALTTSIRTKSLTGTPSGTTSDPSTVFSTCSRPPVIWVTALSSVP